MAQLKYRPEKRNPQGKQKVYFCAHPQDYVLFEEIADAILKRHNCVVWYDQQPNEQCDVDSWLNNLNEMQLFVMPITTKLLTTPNRALDVEYPYALQHHIPVLPLMYEHGLEELYSKKLGDIQFLDRYNQDATAISYDEKLTKYLDSVLVSDELVQKVRSAFDAYIFMSYRKKDRAKAQELMRLIHKNDFCRDIAIWYDEYLVPGEQFNDAIKKALNSSQLFALAVTPNLLEQDNYIMQYEYPMAKQAHKKILPIELDTTDKEKLNQCFNDMPRTVNAYNHELKDGLIDYLHDIAIKDNDDSPEHNYFIGLAYLKGIDVEVDHERALELITYSAQHGVSEAMATLRDMYNTGEGVSRDYMAAISWAKQLAEYCERQYNANPDEDTFTNVVNEYQHLGQSYEKVGKIEDALKIYQKGFEIVKFANISDANLTLFAKSIYLSLIGGLLQANGNLKEAEQYYKQALLIDNKLSEETETVESRRYLSVSCSNLGDICQANGDMKGAEKYYKQSLEIRKQLYKEKGDVENCRDLSVIYSNLGDICQENGNLKGAEQYYQQSLEIAKQLWEETGTMQSSRDLSVIYGRMGVLYQANGNVKEAKQYYEQSLKIFKQLYEETGTVVSRGDLSWGYSNLGNMYKANGSLKKAEQYYKQSLEIDKQLYEETGTLESCRDLSVIYSNIGDIYQANGKLKRAQQYYLQSLEMFKQLYEETCTVESCLDLSICYNKLGTICQENGNLKEAERYYLQSLEVDNQVYEETGTVESCRYLSVSYERLGDVCQENGNLKGAEQYYLQSLDLRNKLYEETGTVESRRDLSICYYKLGNICRLNGNLKEAEQYCQKVLHLANQLYEETRTVKSCRDLSISYESIADLYKASGNFEEAEQYYQQALSLRNQLYEETGTLESSRDLILSYSQLANLYEAIGNLQQSTEYLQKAYDIFQKIKQE